MKTSIEIINNTSKPATQTSTKDKLLSLGYITTSEIAELLGTKRQTLSHLLKVIGMHGNFDDKLRGTTRIISLTQTGIDNLLKKLESKQIKISHSKIGVLPITSTEEIPNSNKGLKFADFKELLAKNKRTVQFSAKRLWIFLIQNHPSYFNTVNTSSTRIIYQLQPNKINEAMNSILQICKRLK